MQSKKFLRICPGVLHTVTMEKLTTAQQQLVKKMSNDRLRVKLIAAGYDEEIVMDMDREVM